MKILAIDSSAVTASVAVADDSLLNAEFFLNTGLTHSRTLMSMIESVLNTADLRLSDIDLFAVTNGPGSFTGVRIGVSSVMGMAEALDKPCIGVSTLLSMAYNLQSFCGIICSVMDARCNQVYTALFESDGTSIKRITDDDAMSLDDLGEKLSLIKRPMYFVGDGAVLCYNRFKDTLSDIHLPSENIRFQRASSLAKAVFDNKLFDDALTPEKLTVSYLRLSQAERERKAKLEVKSNDGTCV